MRLAISINGTPIEAPTEVPTGGVDTGQKIIQIGVTLLFIAAILLALIYLIQGGIQWIVSGGDKQKIDQARLKLTYAVVGLVIVLSAFLIVNVVGGFFKISLSK